MKKQGILMKTTLLAVAACMLLSAVACNGNSGESSGESSSASQSVSAAPTSAGGEGSEAGETTQGESGSSDGSQVSESPSGSTSASAGQSGGATTAKKTTTTKKGTSTTSSTFVSKYAGKKVDLGGRTITIANNKWWTVKNSNLFMDDISENLKDLMKKWNFDIDYVYPAGESSEYHEKLSKSALANAPIADIAFVEASYLFPGLMTSGVVQELTQFKVFDFSEKKFNKNLMDSYSRYKDKYYGASIFGFNCNNYWADIGFGVFFNKEYFEDNSLPDLYGIVRSGDWTWDKMIEVAKKATVTTNGVKTYGLTIWQDAFPFIASSSQQLVTANSDGSYSFNGTNSTIINALEYYFSNAATTLPVNTEKYPWIHPHTGAWDFPMAAFKNNEAAMCVARWSCLDWYFGDVPFDWGFVPFPKQNKSDSYKSFSDGYGYFWTILKGVKKPEEVAMVLDAITDVKYSSDDYSYFVENQACDDETVEMVGLILNGGGVQYDRMWVMPKCVDKFWAAWDSVRTGEATATSAMQSIQQSCQSLVNEVASKLKSTLK